jgi:acyl dehydratase
MNAGLAPLRPGDELPTRTLVARNTAAGDTGSIHDDAYAARMGYRGGLVPGVTLLAYCTPTLIEAFGEAWAQRGRLRASFLRPAYDGETLAVRATVARADGNDVTLGCRIERADGVACVEAEASCLLGEQPSTTSKPWRTTIPVAGPAVPPGGGLPPLAPENMTIGQELSPLTYRLSLAESIAWAGAAGDESAWYRDASPFGGRPIVHPALFARDANRLLGHNFAGKASVHAATDLAYQGVGWPDRDYTVYGYVVDLHERNRNNYAELDTLTVDQDGREIVRHRYTSVIRLREER